MTKKSYHSLSEKRRNKRIAIMVVLCTIVAVAVCFVLGFGLSEGWEVVGAWFTSKWATLTVVSLLITGMVLLYGFFAIRDRKDFR